MNGAKTLVLDPSLAGPLGLITEVALLKVKTVSISLRSAISEQATLLAPWRGQDVLAGTRSPLFYLHHANLDRVFWQWQWQKKNLPKSLNDVSGPIIPFDYQNQQAGNVTLDFEINIGMLAPDVPLKDLLNTQDKLCYTYAKP